MYMGLCELKGAYQGFPRALRVLNKIFHHRVIQEVQPIDQHSGRTHALDHKKHNSIPAEYPMF